VSLLKERQKLGQNALRVVPVDEVTSARDVMNGKLGRTL
jgi:hypothetical protein